MKHNLLYVKKITVWLCDSPTHCVRENFYTVSVLEDFIIANAVNMPIMTTLSQE